jgi:hypothetical protein
VVTGIIPRDNFVENADRGQNSQEKITQSEMESRVDVKQKPSRSGHSSSVCSFKFNYNMTKLSFECMLSLSEVASCPLKPCLN